MKSIFIFRRDFSIEDNLGFIECYKESKNVLPIFIFTPEQIENNEFFSANSFQFMIESLKELDKEFKSKYNSQLHFYYGENIKILKNLYKDYKYDAIYYNKDYTKYAMKRDLSINDFCNENKIKCIQKETYLLAPIGTYLKKDGKEYLKYTPFKDNAKKIKVDKPKNYHFNDKSKFDKIDIEFNIYDLKYKINENIAVNGGRKNALDILKNIEHFINYDKERNDLNTPTTHLSAYIKYGTVSIREVYNAIIDKFKIDNGLINQLYWREFYYYLGYYNPKVLEGKSLKDVYDKIEWENNSKLLKFWKEGKTGFPAVDAGMREMNKTGFMHNRARLITSGILIKILKCDWRLGEKYFAQSLVDYDPLVNNGNWQWSSGSGADSQPYFRILSPWKQAIDNDANCEYIKKWIPELRNIPNKDILNWGTNHNKYKNIYIAPIVEYELARKDIVNIYKKGLYS